MGKNVAVYLRVSTTDQKCELQRKELQHRVDHFLSRGQASIVYEDSFTGKTMNRPGWNQLDADMQAGMIDTIIVWRIDRLGRTASGLTKLFDELVLRGINLISHKDGIDLSTPAGRMMANVLASVAQFETEIRYERQTSGIASAKANGRKWGGSKAGRTSKKIEAIKQTVLAMHATGMTQKDIAKQLKVSRETVGKLTRKPCECCGVSS